MGMRTSPLGCIVKIRAQVAWDMTEELQRRTGQVDQTGAAQAAQLTPHCTVTLEQRQG